MSAQVIRVPEERIASQASQHHEGDKSVARQFATYAKCKPGKWLVCAQLLGDPGVREDGCHGQCAGQVRFSQSHFTLREVCLPFALEQGRATRILSGPGIQVSVFAPAYWCCSLHTARGMFAVCFGTGTCHKNIQRSRNTILSLFIPVVFFKCSRKFCRMQSIHSQSLYIRVYFTIRHWTTCFDLYILGHH